jgi:peptide-methionine (S)-S-oxide reductase
MNHSFIKKAFALSLYLFIAMQSQSNADTNDSNETITLAAGCFWCTEAVMQRVEGVKSAVSGYMGGHVENPSYRQVVTGETGHAEVAQISFDPSVISIDEILEIFWLMHDPTSLNKQGADSGTQYRSAVFYHSDSQKAAVEQAIAALDKSGKYDRPIVTEVSPKETFYPAEDYHQEYYDLNKQAGYCMYVIHPKLKKLGLKD